MKHILILVFIITFFGVWHESSKDKDPIQKMVITEKYIKNAKTHLSITPYPFGLIPTYKSAKYVLRSKDNYEVVRKEIYNKVKIGHTIYIKYGGVYKTYEDALLGKNKL
jgi:hypothetical protein